MVVIRLARWGAKKEPFYRIVVVDSRKQPRANYIEKIGYFNPVARGNAQRLCINDLSRVDHWVSQGAQVSTRVASLIKEARKSQALPSVEKKKIKATNASTTKTKAPTKGKPTAKKSTKTTTKKST